MKHDEDIEQEKVVNYCMAKNILCFSTANGASLSGGKIKRAMQMRRLKKTGLINGTPDLIVMTKGKILFIEMKKNKKVLKNGSLSTSGISVSESQIEFLEKISEFEYACGCICYGSKEAIEFIDKYI